MAYRTPFDIANRCLDHLGVSHITTFADGSRNADLTGFVYDIAKRAELRDNPWNFARRRVALRQIALPGQAVLFPLWDISTQYQTGDVVLYITYNGLMAWLALTPTLGATPINGYPWVEFYYSQATPTFDPTLIYYAGELVALTNIPYINLGDNTANSPYPPIGIISPPWHRPQGATFVSTGPPTSPLRYTTNTFPAVSKNLFSLPFGYLRNVMQDPKTASTPAQLTTGGSQSLDYEIERGYLLSALDGPIIFRFGADIWQVPLMDDLFCEMVACRMAMETCQTITQSQQLISIIARLYDDYRAKAIRTNAIEAGSTEPEAGETKMSRNPALERPNPPSNVGQQQQR